MYRTSGIQKGSGRLTYWGGDGGGGGASDGAGVSGSGGRRGTLRGCRFFSFLGRGEGGGGGILLVSQLKQLCSGRSGPVHYTEGI